MTTTNPEREPVRAAGGLVVRTLSAGRTELVVVHRPHYDDWSLPKGKRKRSEKALDCALREVEEETGLRCRGIEELPRTSYSTPDGTPKVVRWWLMEVVEDHGARQGNEVDEVRWMTAAQALGLLSYDLDASVIRSCQLFTSC